MKRRTFITAAALSSVSSILLTDESRSLEKTVIDVNLGNKLVFLPDLHLHFREKRAEEVLKLLHREDPDIAVVGGDLVDEYTVDEKYVEEFVSEIPGTEKYFVLGNHEYWSGRDDWTRKILAKHGYMEVVGSIKSPKIGKIHGYDWVEKRIYPSLTANGIVVAHDPNAFDHVEGNCIMLAGHTHGGFVIGGISIFANSKYIRGFYHAAAKSLYVSRGLGHILPLRPFSSLELVVLV